MTPLAASSAFRMVNHINYVTGQTGPGSYATYGADGSLALFYQGYRTGFGGIGNALSYTPRLQPCRITAGTGALPLSCDDTAPADLGNIYDISYDFHAGAGDNENVLGITNLKDNNRSQAFSYDLLNRITSAQNTGTDCNRKPVNPSQTVYWGNNYVYDPWGNLLQKIVTKCNAEPLSVNLNGANHITSAGYGYDAAGNLTADATDTVSASFDQENRITGANGFTYTYDADGERVEKSNGATGTLYWNMSPGIIGESDLNGVMKSEYVFFAGERIARRDLGTPGGVFFYFSDHLKTTSIVTDSSGVIKNESDYYPWGGEVQLIANDSNHYKFNGKERDETGLDYYGARYYSNKLGRFVTPDWAGNAVAVPYANFGNPQSLNLYAYVENNPTTLADVDGHLAGSPTSNSPPFDCWNSCLNGGIHYGEFCGLDFGPCPPPHYNPRIDGPDCKMCEESSQDGQSRSDDSGQGTVLAPPAPAPATAPPSTTAPGPSPASPPSALPAACPPAVCGPVLPGILGGLVLKKILELETDIINTKADTQMQDVINSNREILNAHRSKKRRSTKDKHEKVRPGESQPPGYKPFREYRRPKDGKGREKPPYRRKDRDNG